jgi:hypothetical protein
MGTCLVKAVSQLLAAELKNNAEEANRLGENYHGILEEASGHNSWPIAR